MCDIDGVVADPRVFVKQYLMCTPANWSEYFKHTLEMPSIPLVVAFLNGLALDDNTIMFCTGRPESNRDSTLKWLRYTLRLHVGNYHLVMRADKDFRAGSILKLAWARVLKPDLILEDEPDAVKLLRCDGFTVLQIHGHRIGATLSDHIPV
jgi:hypothetical protein